MSPPPPPPTPGVLKVGPLFAKCELFTTNTKIVLTRRYLLGRQTEGADIGTKGDKTGSRQSLDLSGVRRHCRCHSYRKKKIKIIRFIMMKICITLDDCDYTKNMKNCFSLRSFQSYNVLKTLSDHLSQL